MEICWFINLCGDGGGCYDVHGLRSSSAFISCSHLSSDMSDSSFEWSYSVQPAPFVLRKVLAKLRESA